MLITMIDDATSRVFMRFHASDTSAANREMVGDYIRRYGRPRALYTDKASHFRDNSPLDPEDELEGKRALTQLGRALEELEIERIAAHSPQAKGRVERSFGTCQDRLVKLMRLEGIADIESANAYLAKRSIPEWNRRFTHEPREGADAHRSRRGFDLRAILSHQEYRSVANDYTVQYHGARYQILGESVKGGLRRSRVTVEERLDGTTRLRWRGDYLKHRALPVSTTSRAGAAVGLRPPSAPPASPGLVGSPPAGDRDPTIPGRRHAPGHFYLAPNRTFLLCVDRGQTRRKLRYPDPHGVRGSGGALSQRPVFGPPDLQADACQRAAESGPSVGVQPVSAGAEPAPNVEVERPQTGWGPRSMADAHGI